MSYEIKGGIVAHIARRVFHVSMLAIPLIYYYWFVHLASEKILHLLILAFIFLVFLFEKFRIRARLVLFGQRLHEATHISAFAWTMLSMGVVLILSPSVSFSMPIVAACALVDPLMGELRTHHVDKKIMVVIGTLATAIIWLLCAVIYHFSLWFALLLAPITVAVEWPSFRWIDDNALLLLVPLCIILIVQYAFCATAL